MAFKRPKPPDTAAPFVDRTGRITTEWYRFIQQLFTDSTTAAVAVESGAAGATTLDELTDVTITDVENNQSLRYDELTGQWINGAAGGIDGTGAANQIATWSDADTIEGDANFTWDGADLNIGSTASGATNHEIVFRTAGTSEVGALTVGFDETGDTASYGARLSYTDGTNWQYVELDFDREEIQFGGFSSGNPVTGSLLVPSESKDFVFLHRRANGGARFVHDSGGATWISAGTDSDTTTNQYLIFSDATSRITLGVNSRSLYRFGDAGFKQREMSAANSDDAEYGQWWVKDDTPCIPKFTDDAGNDFSIVLDTKTQTLTNKTIDSANNTLTVDLSEATVTGTMAEFDTAASDGNFVFQGESFTAGSSTVAGLPTPATGMIRYVTDANAPSIGSTVAGGGAAFALVTYNGSNWTVIGV